VKVKAVCGFFGYSKRMLMRNTPGCLTKYLMAVGLFTFAAGFAYEPPVQAQGDEEVVYLEDVVVVAAKDPLPAQEIPASVSALSGPMLEDSGVNLIGEAAGYAPNVNMVEFTDRALSQPYFRGIGSGPNNPAVTTYIDGVPQLHGYSANIELLDVRQVEFVRGAQGMLYGRNTVGGVIHILSTSPDFSSWEYSLEGGYGSYNLFHGKFRLSGPLIQDELGFSLAAGYSSRDGFSDNDITGHDINNREAFFGKLQFQWLPTDAWSVRFILFAEQDRDGDYALHDLAAIRANPYHVQRDFEGYLDRDILAPTLTLEYHGNKVDFVSISGLVKWETESATDLDYTPFPATRRQQNIRDFQLSQEFQWRSKEDAPLVLNDHMTLTWQAGTLFFVQKYRETSVNKIFQPLPVEVASPLARLEDRGLGAYGQAILTAWDVWDIALGLRFDYEDKEADLQTFYTPVIAPSTALNTDRDFTEISPQFSLTRKIAPGKIVYGNISRGYRAGGFNPVSPPGSEAYNEETSWNNEIGIKTTWLAERLKLNMAFFHISWEHLQLHLPIGQTYYIANTGDAESSGVELELFARPSRNWDIFGSFGYDRARFGDGSTSIRTNPLGTNTEEDVGGNELIFTPEFTASAGTQYAWDIVPDARILMRTEINGYGRYFYNTANTESQSSYWLTNLRARYKTSNWYIEAWIKNAFDKEYIPIAFEFPNGQSGFLGESGAPQMIGIRAVVDF
jgi:iron complex outermembrane receptor protein